MSSNLGTKMLVLFVIFAVVTLSRGQVTFSRDWNPGKRNFENTAEIHATLKSASAVCRMLMSQIRQIATASEYEPHIVEASDAGPPAMSVFNGKR